ncbi:MAG: phosphohydrolase, partial [Erysipelotrichaceae bacterium]|nr:phosphohydrolase [Erysipelotrichaceae bacterium]
LLHDLYLYDWHDKPYSIKIFEMHGYTHPEEARKNAVRIFNVDEKIQKVIKSHMWPLTLRSFPDSREAAIVCIADKLVATRETINR